MNNTIQDDRAATDDNALAHVKDETLKMTVKRLRQFEAKINKTIHPNGCWIWTAVTNKTGYGAFQINGMAKSAHRVAYRIYRGPIGECHVCHSCDVRNCVNPEHLWLGTPMENMHDRDRKGRRLFRESKIFPLPNPGIPAYPESKDQSLVLTKKQRHNFERKIDRSGGDEACWPWTGARHVRGYGSFGFGGRLHYANRISFRLYNGPIPDGMYSCHKCDSPCCVNPRHLWAGTHLQNMQDRERKGRGNQPTGDRNWTRKHPERVPRGKDAPRSKYPERYPVGEKCKNAKIDTPKLIQIRSLLTDGKMQQREIAAMFGISQTTVWRIKIGITWKHVPLHAAGVPPLAETPVG